MHSQPIQFKLSATMTLPVLLLCLLALIALVAADGPGGYISPWSMGGNMTTIPDSPSSNATKGLPLNLIISNKSDINMGGDLPTLSNFVYSLGFNGPSPDSLSRLTKLPLNDTISVAGYKNGYLRQPEFYSQGCLDSTKSCLQFVFSTQIKRNQSSFDAETAAVFIGAAIAHSTADGVKVVENGYDLARDEIVARATSSYSGQPVIDYSNKSLAYKTTVVYNDTELLSNVSASGLIDNVGTDRRVPILLVETLSAPFKESTKSYPIFNGGAAVWASLPTVSVALFASMIALLPMVL